MEWINKQLKEKQEKETKMRWIRDFKRKNYFTETKISDCKQILRVRLHMARAKCNYKGSFKELKCKNAVNAKRQLSICWNVRNTGKALGIPEKYQTSTMKKTERLDLKQQGI